MIPLLRSMGWRSPRSRTGSGGLPLDMVMWTMTFIHLGTSMCPVVLRLLVRGVGVGRPSMLVDEEL